MERKLAEWRARQALLERPPGGRGVFRAVWARLRLRGDEAEAEAEVRERPRDTAGNRVKKENDQSCFQDGFVAQPIESDYSIFTNVTILKVLLWLVLLGLFIELEFGLAYFVLSMFYWIYIGTRDPANKKQGEVSAYSVFNPGCKAIEGSLTAEQFERELQYRPLAGR
uniref:SAYSvFN domain-containing protein 1 n=1 Tax=Pristiophorus japonicus TaxID=55135 RepID=UPI00398F0CEF